MSVEELLILVIEDEPDIQAIINDALSDGGYKTAIVASGEEAITLLKGSQAQYRVLVTDINLAGRADGWEVARASREIDPEFPVVQDRRCCASMGRQWRFKQRSAGKAFRAFSVGDCHSQLTQHRRPAGCPGELRLPELVYSFN